MGRNASFVVVVVVGLLLSGCQTTIVPDDLGPPAVESEGPTPGYTQLVNRYNDKVRRLDRVWASTEVHLRWETHDGDQRSEHGDGNLIIVRPRKVALTVGKLGNTLLWAGSNQDGYWLFDKRDEGKVFYGRYRFLDEPCSRSLPMPVQPKAVPYLLGMMPLDAGNAPEGDAVKRHKGYYLIEPPDASVRLWLHPKSALPKRVDLLNDEGKKVVSALLREPWPVDQADLPRSKWPYLAHEVGIYVFDENAKMRLELSSASDGEGSDRINPKVFDFDTLMQVHEPAERIDLDADCFDAPAGIGLEPAAATRK